MNSMGVLSPRESWGLACDEASFGAPLMVKFHVAIHPVHFFVVPSFAILAHACEAFPKVPS